MFHAERTVHVCALWYPEQRGCTARACNHLIQCLACLMPELPEIEVTRRGIAPYIEGRRLQRLDIRNPRLRWPVTEEAATATAGRTVLEAGRRGKYPLLRFDNGTQLIHLGMSGSLRLVDPGVPPSPHDHVDWVFDDRIVRLRDPRRFGAVLWHPDTDGAV